MLVIHRSNCIEKLADSLCDFIKSPLESPFAEEIVVVQSNGMTQWLLLHIADRLGIAANIKFTFSASYIWELFHTVLPDLPETSPFDVNIMAWRLMKILSSLDKKEIFLPLTSYLKNGDDLRRYKLSWRIANVFNIYLTYRQEWLRSWEAGSIIGLGKDEAWEAELWRRLAVLGDGSFRRHPKEKFFAELKNMAPEILPKRITLFGISHIAPAYLEIFLNLSKYTEILFFLFSPSKGEWFNRHETKGIDNLLDTLGEHGKEFFKLLYNNAAISNEYEYYDESACRSLRDRSAGRLDSEESGDLQILRASRDSRRCDPSYYPTILHYFQSEILNGNLDIVDRQNFCEPYIIDKNDCSLQIHSCHSAKRELEVLHNYLLDLLNKDKDLKLSDIAVITPDIEAYAPYIESVFGSSEPYIPYSVTGRSQLTTNKIAEGFMSLLDLLKNRFEASKIIALLENPAIKKHFRFTEDDFSKTIHWVRESAIRWGIDELHRKQLKLPGTVEHTWRAGLDRLLLGFALPCKEQKLFQDILSYDDIEGGMATTLGKINNFLETLFKLMHELSIDRTPIDWASYLNQVLENFLDAEDNEKNKIQALRRALKDLGKTSHEAGFTGKLSVEVIKESLQTALDLSSTGFLSGKITFAPFTLMEGVPFKALCLIGMNDGAFPHTQKSCSFNLIIENPKEGDKIERSEDRYIFLKTLLSARNSFYISYTGQNIRDNSVIPPSVLVSELLDTLQHTSTMKDQSSIVKHLVTHHPLQPFSKRYFSGENDRLFSYSKEFCQASQEPVQKDKGSLFCGEKLPELSSEWRTVELEELVRFYESPVRFFLKERLCIKLPEGEDLLENREPFALKNFADADLRKLILSLMLRQKHGAVNCHDLCNCNEPLPVDNLQKLVRAKGVLPHGKVGTVLFNQQMRLMERFLSKIRDFHPFNKIEPMEISIHLEGIHLTGWLHNISNKGWFYYEPARFYYKYINFWIHHLLLNLLEPENVRLTSSWIALDKILTLPAIGNSTANKYLGNLLKYYWKGLSEPLHFFPKSSYLYANKIKRIETDKLTIKDIEDGMKEARASWEGSDFSPGENIKPYNELVFRNVDPIDDVFCQATGILLLPMLKILEEKDAIE